MKTSFTLTLALILSLVGLATRPTFAQTATTAPASASASYKVTVVVSGVNTRSGKLYAGLATSNETFMGETFKNASADVTPSGEITLTFNDVPPGRYAVRVYQDLNNNKKMDFSGQMPDEPFGFSNVVRLMGPPSFDQSSFDLTGDKTVAITMMQM